jgi:predicted Zn-dependent protease
MNEHYQGRHLQAIPFLQRAVELDPNFASAWIHLGVMYNNTSQPQRAAESATRAYELRERVTERERFRIMIWYYDFATGEIKPQIEVLEQYRQTYPRDAVPLTNLFRCYDMLGQPEQAEVAAREALRLTPRAAVSHVNHAYVLLRLNRLAESRAVLQRMKELQILYSKSYQILFSLASLTDDEATQRQVLEQLDGQSDAYLAWQLRAERALFLGKWRQAQALARRAQELATSQRNLSVVAALASQLALNTALLGTTNSAGQARPLARHIQEALALERERTTLSNSALAQALSGHRAQAQALQAELAQRYPRHTLINLVWLPMIRAALALHDGQAAQVLEQLRPVERYEVGADFWPQYVRGLAYLQLRAGSEAAAEFRKITEHRSYAPLSLLWPLAHLGLARATALTGNTVESKKAYEAFFALWKEADADLPLLKEAQREAAQLP